MEPYLCCCHEVDSQNLNWNTKHLKKSQRRFPFSCLAQIQEAEGIGGGENTTADENRFFYTNTDFSVDTPPSLLHDSPPIESLEAWELSWHLKKKSPPFQWLIDSNTINDILGGKQPWNAVMYQSYRGVTGTLLSLALSKTFCNICATVICETCRCHRLCLFV